MTDQRARILGDIRAGLGHGPADSAAVAQEAAGLIGEVGAVQPKFRQLSNLERFTERATSERLTATVDRVPSLEAVPSAVMHYLENRDLPPALAMVQEPALLGLDWQEISRRHEIAPDEAVSLALAHCAIAETGSLVFHSSPESPTLFHFAPLHHLAVLRAGRILRYIEDYWAEMRAAGTAHPRNINLITGTSGTADIEAKNIRGAHGPRFLHIIIVGEEGG